MPTSESYPYVSIYYYKCRECGKELNEETWGRGRRKRRQRLCKECDAKRSLNNYRKHKDKATVYRRDHDQLLKFKTLAHYSDTNPPQCANPFGQHEKPYTDIVALSIDHINGGGNEHRKKVLGGKQSGGAPFYRWLKKHRYPKGYQVLCMNCQWRKKFKKREYAN